MKIGQLAEASGLSPATLRYYERLGLLAAPERRGGKRWYDAAALRRARMLKAARRSGLRIADLVKLTRNGGGPSVRKAVLVERGKAIDEELQRLKQMREILAISAACECENLADCRLALT